MLLSSINIGVKKMGHFESANTDDPRLTPVQLKIVQAIDESLQRDGHSPSMQEIADGDWVVVRRQDSADNGDIVAAMVDSDTEEGKGATVKTYRRRDGHAWLIPHNPAFTPIPADNASIIGKVVAVLRRT